MLTLFLAALKQCVYLLLELISPAFKTRLLTRHDRRCMSLMLYGLLLSLPITSYADGFLLNRGFHPPILLSWSSVWVFAIFGALASLIFQPLDVERRYMTNKPAKVFLGFVLGLAVAVAYDSAVNPSGFAVFVAFVTAMLSTPISYGLYLYVSKEGKVGELIETVKKWGAK